MSIGHWCSHCHRPVQACGRDLVCPYCESRCIPLMNQFPTYSPPRPPFDPGFIGRVNSLLGELSGRNPSVGGPRVTHNLYIVCDGEHSDRIVPLVPGVDHQPHPARVYPFHDIPPIDVPRYNQSDHPSTHSDYNTHIRHSDYDQHGYSPSNRDIESDRRQHNSTSDEDFALVQLAQHQSVEAHNEVERQVVPHPTSHSAIKALRTIKMSQEDLTTNPSCSVCQSNFELRSKVKRLPCKHVFHRECIVPWLTEHTTCPLCRKELPADSPQGDCSHGDCSHSRRRSSWNPLSFWAR